jgi:predicted small secreted protein
MRLITLPAFLLLCAAVTGGCENTAEKTGDAMEETADEIEDAAEEID